MKRIVDVRLGTQEIVKIYKGETLVWARRPAVKVIAASVSNIQIEPNAFSEALYCSDVFMAGTFNEFAVANTDVVQVPQVAALCISDIDAIGAGVKIVPTLAKLNDGIRINICASPTTRVAIANGISKIVIDNIANARDSGVALASAISEIEIDDVASARHAFANKANSQEGIKMSDKAFATSNLYHYIDSHSKIVIDGAYMGDSISTNRANSVGSIDVDTIASCPGGELIDVASHNSIIVSGKADGYTDTPIDALMTDSIVTEGSLHQSSESVVDGTAHDRIHTDAISCVYDVNANVAQSNSTINIDSKAKAALWTYPVLHNGKLTIIQAFETDDSNLPNLLIM